MRHLPSSSSRRHLMVSSAALATTAALSSCSASSAAEESYQHAVAKTWLPFASSLAGKLHLERELVRYATLAPSSHNTQCWRFGVLPGAIAIAPDWQRRCPVVDPDNHHLWLSLGCATENIAQAALAHGFMAQADVSRGAHPVVQIRLDASQAVVSDLYSAIDQRQNTRSNYDGKPVSNADLQRLEQAITGKVAGNGLGNGLGKEVNVFFATSQMQIEQLLALVVAANTEQMGNPAFIHELKSWIRFSDGEAVRTGDGLFSRASGNPAVPEWLGRALFPLIFRASSENDKYAEQVRSSAGIAVFTSAAAEAQDVDTQQAHWLEVGRAYQRFALQAAALGIRTAMLNQPVEVAAFRPQLASYLGIGNRRPHLLVRFGHAPRMPQSLRRPMQAVLA